MRLIGLLFLFFSLSFQPQIEKRDNNVLKLISGKLILSLPVNLKPISEDELVAEYPIQSQRPSYVYENKNDLTKFSINYGSTPAQDKDLPQIKTYFERNYKNSVHDFIGSNFILINHKLFFLMKFETLNTSKALVYNYVFVTTISGKLLIADYAFPSLLKVDKEKQAAAILNSVRVTN